MHHHKSITPEPEQRAASPCDISFAGWWQILKRVWKELKNDRVSFVAAGIAFYLILSLVPALGAVMSIYGLIADQSDVERQLGSIKHLMPVDVSDLIAVELQRFANDDIAAGWGLLLGLILAFWGGSKAMNAMVTSMNVAYEEPDGRSFLRRKSLELGLTVCGVIFAVVVMFLLAVVPAVMAYLELGHATELVITVFRWLLLALAAMTGLSVIYRFAPYRRRAKWRWVTYGSCLGTLLWVAASAILTWYTSTIGDYSKTYGSLGAIVLLHLWFYVTGFVIMLGAELNSEMELQTVHDTTHGEDRPMGKRGAYVADHVAQSGEDITIDHPTQTKSPHQ